MYILQSHASGRFYVGHTNNLSERIKRHNAGRALANKGKGPYELVHVEYFPTRAQAVGRERQIKSKKRRSYIEQLVRMSRV